MGASTSAEYVTALQRQCPVRGMLGNVVFWPVLEMSRLNRASRDCNALEKDGKSRGAFPATCSRLFILSTACFHGGVSDDLIG